MADVIKVHFQHGRPRPNQQYESKGKVMRRRIQEEYKGMKKTSFHDTRVSVLSVDVCGAMPCARMPSRSAINCACEADEKPFQSVVIVVI